MLIGILSMAVMLADAPPVITPPSWRRQPTPEEIAEHYPDKAVDAWVEGKATIACRVSIKGKLNNCEVVSESPEDFGFGNATLGLSGLIEMNPQMVDGIPRDGGQVRIPLHFRLPEPDEEAVLELEKAIQCYGYLGGALDARRPIPDLAGAVEVSRALAHYAARMSLEWRMTVDSRMAAARARPTTDKTLIDDCDAGINFWRSVGSPPPPPPMAGPTPSRP